MFENKSYLSFLVIAPISYIIIYAASKWIDRLYAKKSEILSFPLEISTRSRGRLAWLFTALFASGVYLLNEASFLTGVYVYFAAALLLLVSCTDFEQYVIFDEMLIVFSAIGAAAVLHLGLHAADRAIAAAAGGGVFLALAALTRGAIGGGDVKLIAALGIWLGTERLVLVASAGLVLGGIAAFIMLILKKKSRTAAFAYGPYFAISAIAALLVDGL